MADQKVLNKSDLVRLVAEEARQPLVVTQDVLDAFGAVLQRALAAGTRVVWTGVGTFTVRSGNPRPVVHVASGERVMTGVRRWVGFKSGRGLCAALKGSPNSPNQEE